MRLLVLSALSVLHLFILSWMLSSALLSPVTAIVLIILLYTITSTLALLIIRLIYFKHFKMDLSKHYTSDLGSGLYNNIVAPIVATDSQGNIKWYNKAFHSMMNAAEISTKKITDLTNTSMEDLLSTLDSGDEFKCWVGKKIYQIKAHIASPNESNLFVTVWYDVTDLEETRAQQQDNETLVA